MLYWPLVLLEMLCSHAAGELVYTRWAILSFLLPVVVDTERGPFSCNVCFSCYTAIVGGVPSSAGSATTLVDHRLLLARQAFVIGAYGKLCGRLVDIGVWRRRG